MNTTEITLETLTAQLLEHASEKWERSNDSTDWHRLILDADNTIAWECATFANSTPADITSGVSATITHFQGHETTRSIHTPHPGETAAHYMAAELKTLEQVWHVRNVKSYDVEKLERLVDDALKWACHDNSKGAGVYETRYMRSIYLKINTGELYVVEHNVRNRKPQAGLFLCSIAGFEVASTADVPALEGVKADACLYCAEYNLAEYKNSLMNTDWSDSERYFS
jgi:hypothetical protein